MIALIIVALVFGEQLCNIKVIGTALKHLLYDELRYVRQCMYRCKKLDIYHETKVLREFYILIVVHK